MTKKQRKSSRKWCLGRPRGSKGTSRMRQLRRMAMAGKLKVEAKKQMFTEINVKKPGIFARAFQKMRRMAARGK